MMKYAALPCSSGSKAADHTEKPYFLYLKVMKIKMKINEFKKEMQYHFPRAVLYFFRTAGSPAC